MNTMIEYGVIVLLLVVVVINRNDIFYYDEKTGKIEYHWEDVIGFLYIWFITAGLVIWFID